MPLTRLDALRAMLATPTPAAPSCGTCRFYAQSECRRHAPAPNGRAGDARLRLFPVVDLAEWCGDYEATPCPH